MKHFLIILAILGSSAAWACRCTPPKPINDTIFNSYDLIMKGEVTSVVDEGDQLIIYMVVRENYKGARADTVVIRTSRYSSTCGINARQGNVFLMYAHLYEGQFRTDSCTRTALLNDPSGYVAGHIENDLDYLHALGRK